MTVSEVASGKVCACRLRIMVVHTTRLEGFISMNEICKESNFDQRLLYYRDELNLCLRNLKTLVKQGEVLEREAKVKSFFGKKKKKKYSS